MSELISVIVPVYKVEKYLSKCIESIINQTYSELEIILINDGSPDSCGEICDNYAKKDNRIKVIHKTNGGLSDARNAGIEIATGKYIGFVDSDDYIDKNMYNVLYNSIKSSNAKIAICDRILVFEDGTLVNERSDSAYRERIMNSEEAIIELNSYSTFDMAAWNKLYSRDLFHNIRFPIGVFCEDYYIMHKLFHLAKKIVYNPKALYYYFQRSGSISKDINAYYDFINASKQQLEFIKINYPQITCVAKSAVAFSYIGNYNAHLRWNLECEEIDDFRKEVRNLLIDIIKCKSISMKKKIQATVFVLNKNFYDYYMIKMKELSISKERENKNE